jgi:acetyl-CoA carboxylase biotin carboxyl carrier protein
MADLTRADVDEILKLIDASDFDELRLEMGGLKLELRRRGSSAPAPLAAPVAAAPAPVVAAGPGTPIPAPLLGIFWHAPRPGAAPFVKPGDRVQPDTVIGIIEVMKLMNQVPAGVSGTVLAITAPNGELVEHGACLLRVQPD